MDLLQEIEILRKRIADPNLVVALVNNDVLSALCDAAEAHLQPDLFAVPHQKKSATSAEAARRWRPKAKTNGMKILVHLQRVEWNGHKGLNREEVCKDLGMLTQTATGRLNVLKGAGYIEVRGRREASTGFEQDVYHITQKGRDFLALEAA